MENMIKEDKLVQISKNIKENENAVIKSYDKLDGYFVRYKEKYNCRIFVLADKILTPMSIWNSENKYIYHQLIREDINKFSEYISESNEPLYSSEIELLRDNALQLGKRIVLLMIRPSYSESIRRELIPSDTIQRKYDIDTQNMLDRVEKIVQTRKTEGLITVCLFLIDDNKEVQTKSERKEDREKNDEKVAEIKEQDENIARKYSESEPEGDL